MSEDIWKSGFECGKKAMLQSIDIRQLHADLASAQQRVAELENQTCSDMECTIDQMLSKEQQQEWGFDQQEHRRNIQLMFMRSLNAINELESENQSLRCCNNCNGIFCNSVGEWCKIDDDNRIICVSNSHKYWSKK